MRYTTALAGLAMACASAACQVPRGAFDHRAALDAHDLVTAHAIVDERLETPHGEEPREQGRVSGLWLLDRGGVRWAQGNFDGCRRDLRQADRWLDYAGLTQGRTLRKLRTPDSMELQYARGWAQAVNLPLGIRLFERLAINPVSALCHLELGDDHGACVEARRFAVIASWAERIAPNAALPVRHFGELASTLACARPLHPSQSVAAAASRKASSGS